MPTIIKPGSLVLLSLALLLLSCREEPRGPVLPTATPTPTSAAPTTVPVPSPTPPATALRVISNLNMAAGPEHITDLWAHTSPNGKSYAYLGSSDRPRCGVDITGVHVVDISDARNPAPAGFIPAPPGTRVADVQVGRIATRFFGGDVLAFAVEFCDRRRDQPTPGTSPGIILYDVSNPLEPRRLAGQFSLGFEVHNVFIYHQDASAYVLLVRDESPRDFYIIDITNPATPATVSASGRNDWFASGAQLSLGAVPVSFLHDVWARRYPANHPNQNYAGKTIAYLSYWDAGLVLLDISDPAVPVFLGDSDYLNPDPLTGQPPEGNSHAAVPTEDGNLVFMGDEDFVALRVKFSIESGAFAGEYRALEADFTRKISNLSDQVLAGQSVFVGRACNTGDIPAPPRKTSGEEQYIALIERGDCPFDVKIANVAAAGYDGAIVFNNLGAPEQLITMSGSREKGTIPALFVSRPTAFALLGISPESPPETLLPPPGTAGQQLAAGLIFDGWGYGRVLDVSNSQRIVEVGQFATGNVLKKPAGPGIHSMHNVVVKDRRAYISWYADGIRVVDFSDPSQPREIASFVDEVRGSDFWGVYLYEHPDGKTYILGSDRSSGLWIFETP